MWLRSSQMFIATRTDLILRLMERDKETFRLSEARITQREIDQGNIEQKFLRMETSPKESK
jgi:hypothetical protein